MYFLKGEFRDLYFRGFFGISCQNVRAQKTVCLIALLLILLLIIFIINVEIEKKSSHYILLILSIPL